MSEFDKGYILGKVESFSDNSLEQKTDKKETIKRISSGNADLKERLENE